MAEYFQQKHKAQMSTSGLLFCLFYKGFSSTTETEPERLQTGNLEFIFLF